jgi:flagellar biosynthetic protein FliR
VSQYQAILDHIPPAMLVMFRIGGLMIYGPVFGAAVIPTRVKVFLALLVGLAVYPTLSASCLAGQRLTLELWSVAPLVGLELIIGLLIGYMASLPLIAAQTGGLLMGQQMGLGFARFYNPGMDAQADIVGQMLFFMALAGFLIIGGHEAMMLAVLRSFQYVPLGGLTMDGDVLTLLAGLLLAAFELALRVAAPVLALVFLESLAMGYMAKTVPQLNILSLGFPIRILAGFAMITLALVVMNDVIMDGIDVVLNEIFMWVEGGA